MRSFRRTLAFLRPYRWRVLLAVAMTLLVTALQVAPPRVFQHAIDAGIKPAVTANQELARAPEGREAGLEARAARAEASGRSILIWSAVALACIVMTRSLVNFGLQLTLAWIGHRFCFDLRFATWRHLHRLSLAYHNQTQTGKIMARATGDIELIQQLIQGQLVTFLSDIVTLLAVLGMLFWIEWRLAVVILALIPFYVVSYLSVLRHIRAVSQEQRRLWDEMLGKLAEKISAIAVVKAFVREDQETESFMSSVRRKFHVDMRQVRLNRWLGLLSGVISALGTGVVYAYGGWLVQTGQLTVGALVAITFYIGFVFNPAVRVVDFNNTLQWAVAAMDRVFETLDRRPEVLDKADAVPVGPLRSEVLFDSVTFAYDGQEPVIRDVSFRAKPGEVVAIVGPSGAGKTTLMNLLMRFYDPQRGLVAWDSTDLRDVRLESLRRQMSMVAQESIVFSVSIMENIKYGARGATDAQAIEAAKAADLHDFVMELEDGYETKIGEDGMKLSGGQRQRLALARALVTDPSVLILDDVTSALDAETEARVQDALKRVMRGRTTFIIAHRLSSVVEAGQILVLDGGRIVARGTHAELVEQPGIYQDMYHEQFRSALALAPGDIGGPG
jgi:subfamily B ATP-binding cassette protein MsbA